MAVESRINADDEWFVGEDRVLRFTFKDAAPGIEGWMIAFELYERRAVPADAPVMTVSASAAAGPPPVATVNVDGDLTLAVGPGIYQFVLRRIDDGSRTILAYGPAELRSVVNA